jgi:hypothetical protein
MDLKYIFAIWLTGCEAGLIFLVGLGAGVFISAKLFIYCSKIEN